MRREEVLAKLKAIEPVLRGLGVDSLYLFGSHARDEAAEGSDIDVFVDPMSTQNFGFHPFMHAYHALREIFGENVDYGTRSGLHPRLRRRIEGEAIRVF